MGERMRAPALALLLGAVVAIASGAGGVRPAGLGDVREVRVFDHERYTRVVVELSREADYETHLIANPERLYIDIDGIWIEPDQAAVQAPVGRDAPIRLVRGGQNTLQRARVVVELAENEGHRVFHLDSPYRIVTDVFRDGAGASASQLHPGSARADASSERGFDARPVRRVAIDAGHGGKDPGAVARGLREKDVVLRIAREVAKRLRAAGLEVIMTRSDDRFLELRERTELAGQRGADLFVSIHANASPNRRTSGVETYLLDTRYDRQTAQLAARENGTSVRELSDLQMILASLRLGYSERFAALLADSVHRSLVRRIASDFGRVRDLGVKRGPFLVLFQADVPAVLVEVGFVTHKAEAKRMKTRAFARSAAEGIARGILGYRDLHARRVVAER